MNLRRLLALSLVALAACADPDADNAVPTVQGQSVTTPEDTPLSITVDAVDPEGTELQISFTPPNHGAVMRNGLTLKYSPNPDYNGPDAVVVTVTDGVKSATATLSIIVTAVNDAPLAEDDALAANEDTAVTVAAATLLGNDTDIDDDPLQVSDVGSASNGTVTLSDGGITYVPAANFTGAATFEYTVSDGTASDVGIVTVTVGGVNDAPVAVDDAVNGTEDTAVVIPVATLVGNDTDTEGQTLSVSAVSGANNGTVSLVGSDVTFMPAANFNGAATFQYTVSDGAATDQGAVTITVAAVNDVPVAAAGSASTNEDVPVTITLTASDVEASSLTFSVATGPSTGSLGAITQLSPTTASVTYTPAANLGADDSFTFLVSDGTDDSAPASIAIDVTAVNDAPLAVPGGATTNEDTAVTITLFGSDTEGSPLTFSIAGPPSGGTLGAITQVSATTAQVIFTPATNGEADQSFSFRVNDGTADSAPASVAIDVVPVNDVPVATAGSSTTNEDTAVTITLRGTDVEGSALTFSIVAPPAIGTLGAITPINSTSASVVFTPASNDASDRSFTFKVNDGTAESAAATVSIDVVPANDAPVATAGSATTNEDTPVIITLAGTDVEGSPLTFTVVTQPGSGTLGSIVPLSPTTASVTFTPAANASTDQTFTFRVNDGTANSTPATVSIDVVPVNDAPAAASGNVNTNEDTPVTITLLGSDLEGSALTFAIGTPPASGTLGAITQLSPTTASVTFTPAPNGTADQTFTFRVNDGTVDSAPATVSIDVVPVNDLPVATPQSVQTNEDTSVNITLSGSDVEGSALTFSIVAAPGTGTLGVITQLTSTTARVTYTPNANVSTDDSFTFRVDDGTANSSVAATVSIDVVPVNDFPVATPGSATTNEDTAVTITLSGTDAEGTTLAFSIASGPSTGTLGAITPLTANTARVVYTPGANVSTDDGFTFRVDDGFNSTVATVSLDVVPVNDVPVATAQSVTTNEDSAVTITLAGSDVEGSALTFAIVGMPATGTLGAITQLTPNTASVTFTPVANSTTDTSFTFRVNDGTANSTTATVSIDVVPVNDLPVATAQSVTTNEDSSVNITLAGTDVEGSALTFAIVGSPATGTLGAISQLGPTTAAVTFTPAANSGTDTSFTFRVNDGTVPSAVATVSIDVVPVNDAPVAIAASVTTNEDTPLTITLTGSDVEGSTLSFSIVAGPATGTLGAITPLTATSARVIYTPNANASSDDSFTFRVNDGSTDSSAATLSIDVVPVNDLPVATAASVTTNEDTPVTITLTGSDVEGSALTFAIASGPGTGSLGPITQLTPTSASVTFTPAVNGTTDTSFTFRVNDGTANSTAATVSIDVVPVNDAPVAVAASVTTNEDTPVTITLTGSDTEGSTLSFSVVAGPTTGSLGPITLLSATTAQVVYTPDANVSSDDSFTFRVSDGSADSSAATASIDVVPVNDLPVADAVTVTTNQVGSSRVDLQACKLEYSIVSPK